jgi:hypothetical protein
MEKVMNEEKLVFRQFALPVSTFDYLKDFQRAYEGRHGVKLNNNQVIAVILSEHKHNLNVEGGIQHGNNNKR